jgi:pimeloyl-ACP methyl ester carboxylesterase
MKSSNLLCLDSKGFHRMHYLDWGDPEAPRVVICVHGLTRNGRDFDALAQALASDFRVVCPDMAGRGKSGWLSDKSDYNYPQYLADVTALMARLTSSGDKEVYWVGTSMGGIIGMLLAALPRNPLRRLVINDVSAVIPKDALARIATYVGKDPRFVTYDELENYVRTVSAPFGPLSDQQWRHLTMHGAKEYADGTWGMCYDPGIGVAFQQATGEDIVLWQHWDAIRCPTLLLRGDDAARAQAAAGRIRRRRPRPDAHGG